MEILRTFCFKILKSKFNNVQVELLSASRLLEL